jgi:hypothetical protein
MVAEERKEDGSLGRKIRDSLILFGDQQTRPQENLTPSKKVKSPSRPTPKKK